MPIRSNKGDKGSKLLNSVNGDNDLQYITPMLRGLAVPVDSLTPDPRNANLHPEESTQAIMESLQVFGQLKPLVVRQGTNVIVAGNGTLEAAKRLGWQFIAVVKADLNHVNALHYGLADNRVAQLSRLDYEVVQQIISELEAAGEKIIAFTDDQLAAIRISEWVPPSADDAPTWIPGVNTVIQVSREQKVVIDAACNRLRENLGCENHNDAQAIALICQEWIQYQVPSSAGVNDAPQEQPEAPSHDVWYRAPGYDSNNEIPF